MLLDIAWQFVVVGLESIDRYLSALNVLNRRLNHVFAVREIYRRFSILAVKDERSPRRIGERPFARRVLLCVPRPQHRRKRYRLVVAYIRLHIVGVLAHHGQIGGDVQHHAFGQSIPFDKRQRYARAFGLLAVTQSCFDLEFALFRYRRHVKEIFAARAALAAVYIPRKSGDSAFGNQQFVPSRSNKHVLCAVNEILLNDVAGHRKICAYRRRLKDVFYPHGNL